jgi:hypothetical protein
MSTIINRLRWLSAGIYLGMALFAWLAQDNDKKKNINWDLIPSSPGTEAYEPDDRKIDIDTDMPGQWSSYKHNHKKAENNA